LHVFGLFQWPLHRCGIGGHIDTCTTTVEACHNWDSLILNLPIYQEWREINGIFSTRCGLCMNSDSYWLNLCGDKWPIENDCTIAIHIQWITPLPSDHKIGTQDTEILQCSNSDTSISSPSIPSFAWLKSNCAVWPCTGQASAGSDSTGLWWREQDSVGLLRHLVYVQILKLNTSMYWTYLQTVELLQVE